MNLKEVASEFCGQYSSCHQCPERSNIIITSAGGKCLVHALANNKEAPEGLFSRLYHWHETRPTEPKQNLKTRSDMFFELFPGASSVSYTHISPDGGTTKASIPSVCAKAIFADIAHCSHNCVECWHAPAPSKNANS